jgi:GNAT superfamily N-acetyltransferase
MSSKIPTLATALETTQKKLTEILGEHCTVKAHATLNDNLLKIIINIDNQKFREELRYEHEDILEHGRLKGFMLIIAECEDQPIGMTYGYDELQSKGYFLDTLASMIEGKGIGRILATLLLIHCQNKGYKHVTLYTEERDEKGRQLRRFYEKMGFTYIGTEEGKGDIMQIQLTDEKVSNLYAKYVAKNQRAD